MSKYHITENGKPGVCTAEIRACKYGSPNEHFDSPELAQEYADKINEKSNLIEEINKTKKLLDVIKLTKKLKLINQELNLPDRDGLKSSINQKKEKDIEYENNIKKFKSLTEINKPKNIENLIYASGYFSRYKIGSVYRGETTEKSENGGLALYGEGIYSTTNKKYAQTFGKVRNVEIEEMPAIPISFKTITDFDQFEHLLARQYGIKKSDLGNPNEYLYKMGYDGITIGPKKDMIICLFKDELKHQENYKKSLKNQWL